MSGLIDMAKSFDNTGKYAKKGKEGAAAIQNAISSKPHSTHKQNVYSTYQNNYPQQTNIAGRNVFQPQPQQQWGPFSFSNNWQQPLNNNWQQPLNNNWQSGKGNSFFQYY